MWSVIVFEIILSQMFCGFQAVTVKIALAQFQNTKIGFFKEK